MIINFMYIYRHEHEFIDCPYPPFAKVAYQGASSSPWHCSVQLLRALRHQGLRVAARSHVALVTVVEWHQAMQVLQHAQVGETNRDTSEMEKSVENSQNHTSKW